MCVDISRCCQCLEHCPNLLADFKGVMAGKGGEEEKERKEGGNSTLVVGGRRPFCMF